MEIWDFLWILPAIVVSFLMITVLGGGFREWNEGKEKLRYESSSKSIKKSFFTGLVIIFILVAINLLIKSC